ncbi:MAG: type II secretion system protein M [Gammaproteobacteria bacterium]|nr:type II secretion system protein M [Gammaproteobacteria bacterium]
MIDNLREWFGGLQAREQLLVSIAAVVLVAAMLFLLFEPLFKATERAQQRVAEKTQDLATLGRARSEVAALGGVRNTSAQNSPLVVIIDRFSSSTQLAPFLKRNQPDGNNAIRVTFEAAPFGRLIDFLVELESRHGLVLSNATLNKAETQGTVNASLTLVRTGA